MNQMQTILGILLMTGVLGIGCDKADVELSETEESETSPINNVEEESLLIQPKTGVANIRWGMTVEQIKDILGQPDGDTGQKLTYDEKGLTVIFNDKIKVSSIIVKSSSYKTQEGIGVGTTIEDVIATYGKPIKKNVRDKLYYKDMEIIFNMVNGKVDNIMVLLDFV